MNIAQIALAGLSGFGIALVLGYAGIPLLHKLKFGQYIREEGPEAHQKKKGTPTMGGVIFLLGFLASCLLFGKEPGKYWIVPVMTFAFGLVGAADDFIKIVLKHNEGLKPGQKFLLQFLCSLGLAIYLYLTGHATTVTLYITGVTLDLKWGYYVLVVVGMMALDNGTNFTDGLDGLSTTVTMIITVFLVLASAMLGSGLEIPAAAFAGALMGFLFFNAYPARVFMGDTGSLALGGFVGTMTFLMDIPLLILLFGIIYVVEVLSVILQVGYFKLTHGKRLFKMAPIHHHFELKGWHETRVVAIFSIVTALMCILCLAILA
ncbi:MAG: phospho-N-acetylmuramoyl-pentapeptide-transferase [Lachnospiraceae bacterium]|nr:phospho-N-acetylmuramoyl-pentapeptide-transferase [Lachnospiraceae bacterium]